VGGWIGISLKGRGSVRLTGLIDNLGGSTPPRTQVLRLREGRHRRNSSAKIGGSGILDQKKAATNRMGGG